LLQASAAAVALSALAAGCAAASGAATRPARLVQPAPEACLAQIQDFAAAVTGQRITLGPTVFSIGDELVLERSTRRDAQGRPLDGRERAAAPQVFRLTLRGALCVVSHPDSARKAELAACTCVPLASAG
jgi:hypothetical protein